MIGLPLALLGGLVAALVIGWITNWGEEFQT